MLGVVWGSADEFGTPAFWKLQTALKREAAGCVDHGLGESLLEEVAACLLGGYGIPAEIGLVAFGRLKEEGLLDGWATREEIERVLATPLDTGGGERRYRFARQKSDYLARTLAVVRTLSEDCSDLELRATLLGLPGVGPKTASWIVRNYRNSNSVAILDVHVVRACTAIGLFPADLVLSRSYFELEDAFLEFCLHIDEPAAMVDALMWDAMRRIGPTARAQRHSRRTSDEATTDTQDLFVVTAN